MIKNIFLLLLVCISMSAQDLHIYCYSNYDSVILKLDSENRYTLSSLNRYGRIVRTICLMKTLKLLMLFGQKEILFRKGIL